MTLQPCILGHMHTGQHRQRTLTFQTEFISIIHALSHVMAASEDGATATTTGIVVSTVADVEAIDDD